MRVMSEGDMVIFEHNGMTVKGILVDKHNYYTGINLVRCWKIVDKPIPQLVRVLNLERFYKERYGSQKVVKELHYVMGNKLRIDKQYYRNKRLNKLLDGE